jgi:hypothetical protein
MATTLLDMVQDLLTSLDSFSVNSIADTEESLSVARIISQSYRDLVALWDIPENKTFFELESSGDADQPTLMYRPAAVSSIEWVKYNQQLSSDTLAKFRPVTYVPLDKFTEMMYNTTEGDNVVSYPLTLGDSSIDIICTNDKWPTYYTSFNDSTIIFDSYMASEDAILVKNKSLAYGLEDHEISLTDTFVFPLDTRQLSLLFNSAKLQAFIELKQVANPVAQKRERDGLIQMERTKQAIKGAPATYFTPDYGRKR